MNTFIVTGASSGFGLAITKELCKNDNKVIGVARREEKLKDIRQSFPDHFEYIAGDITHSVTLDKIEEISDTQKISGIVLNSGGPPVGPALETRNSDWDAAYQLVFRWKVDLLSRLVPKLQKQGFGRVLFIESQSIKQPIPNLVQSNAMRAAVAGYAKTLALEVAKFGVTVNILAPGSHKTLAIERIIDNKMEMTGKSRDEIIAQMENGIPVGRMGEGEELASLAHWLLSEKSGYVTGQVISHDGGNIRHIMG